MDRSTSSMRDLARHLLAAEASKQVGVQPIEDDAVRVCEKLRVALTRFAGADGFSVLLRRALALAKAEVPGLHGVTVPPDGCMEGVETLLAGANKSDMEGEARAEAGLAITAHLLTLLVTFIGEPLTLRLVREAWPDGSLGAMTSEK